MKRFIVAVLGLGVLFGAGLYLLWPREQRGLVLYSAVDYGPAVATAFTKKTGIPVTLVDLSTGALLAKVSAEGQRPAWSLVWFDGDLAAAALDKAGLLATHTTPNLPWNDMGKQLIPADGSYTPTGLTLAGAFTYRKDTITDPPSHWSDLTNPSYRGAVGMNNPAISGPMYPLLAGVLHQAGGWPKGQSYVLALGANGLHVYTKNANTLAAVQQGEIKIAVTQSSAALYFAASHPAYGVAIPNPAFALPSVIAMSPNMSSEIRGEAEQFVRFAMSPDIQKLRMAKGEGDGKFWPVTKNIVRPSGLPPLSSLTITVLDPKKWGPREEAVNAWFSKAVMQQ
ncbi:MAG: extracellular solute-binding protein [Alphaproteobacteria bacterium]|nr:extracellular solute-binding protein [Alphaproteobacteria bacterium]MDE2112245.1 extracellular solute-binding protein [Alphaproteobacteria bacterium]MDE2494177.1 extracellular solute-binding protein [Alphaproteobacteria bacterium]